MKPSPLRSLTRPPHPHPHPAPDWSPRPFCSLPPFAVPPSVGDHHRCDAPSSSYKGEGNPFPPPLFPALPCSCRSWIVSAYGKRRRAAKGNGDRDNLYSYTLQHPPLAVFGPPYSSTRPHLSDALSSLRTTERTKEESELEAWEGYSTVDRGGGGAIALVLHTPLHVMPPPLPLPSYSRLVECPPLPILTPPVTAPQHVRPFLPFLSLTQTFTASKKKKLLLLRHSPPHPCVRRPPPPFPSFAFALPPFSSTSNTYPPPI